MRRLQIQDVDDEIRRQQELLSSLHAEQSTLIRLINETRIEEEQRRSSHRLHQAELQDSWDKLSTLRTHIAASRRKLDDVSIEEAAVKNSMTMLLSNSMNEERPSNSYIINAKMRLRDELIDQIALQEGILRELRRQIELRSEALLSNSSSSSISKSIEESLSLRQNLVTVSADLEKAEADFMDLSLRLDNLKSEIKQSLVDNAIKKVDVSTSAYQNKYKSIMEEPSVSGHSDYSLYEVLSGQAGVLRMTGEDATMFRRRLNKNMNSLIILERQLQSDLDEKAHCVRRTKDEYREAELRRLRFELQLSNLEPVIKQKEVTLLSILNSPQLDISTYEASSEAMHDMKAVLEDRFVISTPHSSSVGVMSAIKSSSSRMANSSIRLVSPPNGKHFQNDKVDDIDPTCTVPMPVRNGEVLLDSKADFALIVEHIAPPPVMTPTRGKPFSSSSPAFSPSPSEGLTESSANGPPSASGKDAASSSTPGSQRKSTGLPMRKRAEVRDADWSRASRELKARSGACSQGQTLISPTASLMSDATTYLTPLEGMPGSASPSSSIQRRESPIDNFEMSLVEVNSQATSRLKKSGDPFDKLHTKFLNRKESAEPKVESRKTPEELRRALLEFNKKVRVMSAPRKHKASPRLAIASSPDPMVSKLATEAVIDLEKDNDISIEEANDDFIDSAVGPPAGVPTDSSNVEDSENIIPNNAVSETHQCILDSSFDTPVKQPSSSSASRSQQTRIPTRIGSQIRDNSPLCQAGSSSSPLSRSRMPRRGSPGNVQTPVRRDFPASSAGLRVDATWSSMTEVKSQVPSDNSPNQRAHDERILVDHKPVITPTLPNTKSTAFYLTPHLSSAFTHTPQKSSMLRTSASMIQTDDVLGEVSIMDVNQYPEVHRLMQRVSSLRAALETTSETKTSRLAVLVVLARNLPETKKLTRSADTFVQLQCGREDPAQLCLRCDGERQRTTVQWGSTSPSWVEQFLIEDAPLDGNLVLTVMDTSRSGDYEAVGWCTVSLSTLTDQRTHKLVLPLSNIPLTDKKRKRGRVSVSPSSELKVELRLSHSDTGLLTGRLRAAEAELKRLLERWRHEGIGSEVLPKEVEDKENVRVKSRRSSTHINSPPKLSRSMQAALSGEKIEKKRPVMRPEVMRETASSDLDRERALRTSFESKTAALEAIGSARKSKAGKTELMPSLHIMRKQSQSLSPSLQGNSYSSKYLKGTRTHITMDSLGSNVVTSRPRTS